MKAQSNTADLWDQLWQRPYSESEDRHRMREAELSIRWRRIRTRVEQRFGSLDGLEVIEVGAGSGMHAALMAAAGANVTVLDYAPRALQRSEELFDRRGLKATMIHADALQLPESLVGQFDVSMSFGLTEHFLDQARDQINASHFDLLRDGGVTFIAVPHRNNPPYRLFKFVAERTGHWKVGEEYPYNRRELVAMCQRLNVRQYEFFGESAIASLHFLNPLKKNAVRKLLGLGEKRYDASRLRQQRGTPFDTPLSYSLVLCGVQDSDRVRTIGHGLARSA